MEVEKSLIPKNQNRQLQKFVTADFFIDTKSIDLINRKSCFIL